MGGQKVKKGVEGANAKYITRAQALKKLQISLVDFRRLCILKGIYPREPKKKLYGADKIYYHIKDINHLRFDPIVDKIRELKVYLIKYRKAMGRNDRTKAKNLVSSKPTIPLNHIVKERYPSFTDALKDLDDALSTCTLFASLPSDDSHSIPANVIEMSTRLVDEFIYIVAKKNYIKKSFISIKGFYFQAEILNQEITWIIPHQFTQKLPDDVDFRVMTTFLEFYHVLLKFVNFKLYQINNCSYPPNLNKKLLNDGARYLSYHSNDLSNIKSNIINNSNSNNQLIFDGLVFFINREVPLVPISLAIQSLGGIVGWDSPNSPIKNDDKSITHFIVDKPSKFLTKLMDKHKNATFIQPQWIFDCLNENFKLSSRQYKPDMIPPPHLSPFVNDKDEGYIPEQREILNELKGKSKELYNDTSTIHTDDIDSDPDIQYEKEKLYLQSIDSQSNTQNTTNDSLNQVRKSVAEKLSKEETRIRKSLLSKKHKRLLDRIEYTKNQSGEQAQKLLKKRNKLKK